MKKRLYWVDTLKAIGIFFVVWGHVIGTDYVIRRYIYSFHMPLFFFISGLLCQKEYIEGRFSFIFAKRFRSLVIPYVIVGIVTFIATGFIKKGVGLSNINLVVLSRALAYGIGSELGFNVVLWFFTCLFSTHLIFYGFLKLTSNRRMLILFLVFSGISSYGILHLLHYRLPWNIEIALSAVVFYGIGYLLQGHSLITEKLNPKVAIALFLFFFLTNLLFGKLNVFSDMNTGTFHNPVYFYLAGLSGILSWVIIAQYIPVITWISFIGNNTLYIFSFHLLLSRLLYQTEVLRLIYIPTPNHAHTSFMVSILYSVIVVGTLALSVFIVKLLYLKVMKFKSSL